MSTNEAQASGKSKTVTVGCKLPHGLQLRLFKMVEFVEPVLGGGTRTGKRAEMVGSVVKINGYAAPFGERPQNQVVGGLTGYALTFGVDREFFEEYLRQNRDSDVVKNGLLFAADGEQRARDIAKERRGVKNGLEPLDPNNLPRVSRRLKVETAKAEEAA